MNSALYQCKIFHKRLKPKVREFSHSVFMMSLDLDELDELASKHWLFSSNRWNIYSINDADYFQDNSQLTIKQKLHQFLTTQNVDLETIKRITLQTFPRIFGYQFNPVSFYYLENAAGETFAAVAEVGNTFLEKKLYLLDQKDERGWFSLKTPKDFYVSPFSKVDDYFDFQFGPVADKWSVNINDEDNDGLVLVSTIRGAKTELSSCRLFWFIFRYPLLTLRVIFLIHWHALVMWIRKFPVSNKTKTADQQSQVLRPHKSLTKK